MNYSRRDMFLPEEKDALLPLPETVYEYMDRKQVKVGQDFSFVYDKVHYSMPRKYLRKTLEIRAGAGKIYVYNEHGDRIRTHDRNYTPKSWVVIPSDMPTEYGDYDYWNKPYFLAKAEHIGPNTKILIQNVIEKFDYRYSPFETVTASCVLLKNTEIQHWRNAAERRYFTENTAIHTFLLRFPCMRSLKKLQLTE